jgi:hypothetical protein
MINLLGSFTTDKNGQRLPLKTAAATLVVKLLVAGVGLWAVSLFVLLYAEVFIGIGLAAAAFWYHLKYGIALPPSVSGAIATRKSAKAALPVAEEPAPRARTAASVMPSKPQIGGGRL